MATSTRFDNLDEETLEKIVTEKDSANTHQVIKTSVNILKDYLHEKSMGTIEEMNVGTTTSTHVAGILRKFYAELRKVDGSHYSKKSLITIRYGLQKHFLKKRDEDIINNDDYKKANEMFKSVLVQLKKAGMADTKHKTPIHAEDMDRLYKSDVFSLETPEGLQNRVIFEYLYYFCKRGRENLRDLQKSDFQLHTNAQGRRFVTAKSRQTKNHRGDDLRDTDKEGCMYDQPGNPDCPVATLEKYLSKLHPDNPNMWQRPKNKICKITGVWYDNSPVGKNTLNNFMANLSKRADLSVKYTNHCIRATCITTLDHKGVEARHIMGISGHKSENSIRSYSERLSEDKKRQMSDILSENVMHVPVKSLKTGQNTATSTAVPHLQCDINSASPNNFSDDTSLLPLPDFLDDKFNQILADISAYELNQLQGNTSDEQNLQANQSISVNNNIDSTKTTSSGIFNFHSCTVNINLR